MMMVDQEQVMVDVPESSAVRRPRRNTRKPSWLTTDMVVAYSLPVVEEAIPSTYRELKSVQNQRCRKMPWKKK